MRRLPVGVVGATGLVGQYYLSLLQNHPWFELAYIAASPQQAGHSYRTVMAERWIAPGTPPDLLLENPDPPTAAGQCELLFIAADVDARLYAELGLKVIDNSARYRARADVPLLLPEINSSHLSLLTHQPWSGGLVAKPNCSLQSYLLPLYPLHQAFGLQQIFVTTQQSLSGGGQQLLQTGIGANVVPYIVREEEKSEEEPLKILGRVQGGKVLPSQEVTISATCTRVPLPYGHLACVSVAFKQDPTHEQILAAWREFPGLQLPSAPLQPIRYLSECDGPQPLRDLHDMEVRVGRLRRCPLLQWRFIGLSHNLIRGASGGGLLNAELWIDTYASQSPSRTPWPLLSLSRNHASTTAFSPRDSGR